VYKVKRANIYLVLLAMLFLHLTVLNYVKIFGAEPDLMLICVVFFGLFLGTSAGLEIGLIAGALKDIFALDFLGINAFIFGLVGVLAGAVSMKFSKESKMAQLIVVFSFTIFSMSLHFVLFSIFSKGVNFSFSENLIASIMPTAIYTSLVSIPIFSRFVNSYNLRGIEEFL